MNTAQKAVLVGGLLVLVAMFLYPPWGVTLQSGLFWDVGYVPLWRTQVAVDNIPAGDINYPRLLTQWLLVAVATGVLYRVCGAPNPKRPDSE